MDNDQCENIDTKAFAEHNNMLINDLEKALQISKEKDGRIAYLLALIDVYEECTQKFAALTQKLTERLRS